MPFSNLGMNWNAWCEQYRTYVANHYGETYLPDLGGIESATTLETKLAEFDTLIGNGDRSSASAVKLDVKHTLEAAKGDLNALADQFDEKDPMDVMNLLMDGIDRLDDALRKIEFVDDEEYWS